MHKTSVRVEYDRESEYVQDRGAWGLGPRVTEQAPNAHREQGANSLSSKREDKLQSFPNCFHVQHHNTISCYVEFPSRLRIRATRKRTRNLPPQQRVSSELHGLISPRCVQATLSHKMLTVHPAPSVNSLSSGGFQPVPLTGSP